MWEKRQMFLPVELTCPFCKGLVTCQREVEEWDSETFEPVEETAGAPEGWCDTCKVVLFKPYDIVLTETGCYHCHEFTKEGFWGSVRGKKGIYCGKDCCEAAKDVPR